MDPAVDQNIEAGQQDSEQDLRSLMDGAYSSMEEHYYMGRNFIIAGEVRADNVFANGNSGRFQDMSKMNFTERDNDPNDMFQRMYATLANPNIIINTDTEDLEVEEEGEEDDINHILGEAYAVRAMVHFDLLRLWGQQFLDEGDDLGITYVKEYKGDSLQKPRGSVEENKANIYNDIEEAIGYLDNEGAGSSYESDHTKITLDAVYALKSRVGTYFEDYGKVRDASENLIGKYSLTPAEGFVDYWSDLGSPGEASIFELEYGATDNPSIDGLSQIYRGADYGDIQVFDDLIDDAGFDSLDVRASDDMIGIDAAGDLSNLGKYPSSGTQLGEDNIKVFRYAEVVLNYAEAMLDQDPDKSKELLNDIVENRFLPDPETDPDDTEDALDDMKYSGMVDMDDILEERRKELMFEGFRFFDLVREHKTIRQIDNSTANQHGEIEPGNYKLALPIPLFEKDSNKETEQNPGY